MCLLSVCQYVIVEGVSRPVSHRDMMELGPLCRLGTGGSVLNATTSTAQESDGVWGQEWELDGRRILFLPSR